MQKVLGRIFRTDMCNLPELTKKMHEKQEDYKDDERYHWRFFVCAPEGIVCLRLVRRFGRLLLLQITRAPYAPAAQPGM